MDEILDKILGFDLFIGVPREQVEWLVRESEIIYREPSLWFQPGFVLEFMFIILEGEIQAYVVQSNQKRVQFTNGPGTLNGLIPFSRMKTVPVYLEVLSPLKALCLPKNKFHALLSNNYELTEDFVHGLVDRAKHFSTLHFQNEKLMSLGKLSAGLAHELNNPSAAIVRSAGDLRQIIGSKSNLETFATIQLTPPDIAFISSIIDKANDFSPSRLPLLERKAREEELTGWLDANNIDIDCAETFANCGITPDGIDNIRKMISAHSFLPVLKWLANSLEAEMSVHEIETSANRISELVKSVKSYTRMDQIADMQEVQINDGVRNTLTMLDYKATLNNVAVHEELDENLPMIMGFPGELNQVWTNIIDNAIDAMKNGGELKVRTLHDGDNVTFCVIDNGPGIPPENLERIFDPFFTTKDVGEGTGVGLDLVQKVIQIHKGTIKVNSQPGHTEFRISFPIIAGK